MLHKLQRTGHSADGRARLAFTIVWDGREDGTDITNDSTEDCGDQMRARSTPPAQPVRPMNRRQREVEAYLVVLTSSCTDILLY